MNARYYVPGIARFASADTLVPDPTNPQSLNRYSYVRNNPLNLTDPTGHYAANVNGATDHCYGQYDCQNSYTPSSENAIYPEGFTNAGKIIISDAKEAYDEFRDADYFVTTFSIGPGYGPSVSWTQDKYRNHYVTLGGTVGTPGASLSTRRGYIFEEGEDNPIKRDEQTEDEMQETLSGTSLGASLGYGPGGGFNQPLNGSYNYSLEYGLYTPAISFDVIEYTWLFYDNGSSQPWIWQRLFE